MKSYSELMKISSFEDRFEYLKLKGKIGEITFGGGRSLNQILYKDPRWKSVRARVIARDRACDLAHEDFEIHNHAYIHHINPITREDVLSHSSKVFDEENLITTSFNTHQAIHFGSSDMIKAQMEVERRPNDTCPWRS